ncbi:hypothetical protein FSARC_12074 [Fusarium sarcochroum]|uniref:Zn(2)-C6 fungal-type domain-containing protein n=1 Tax=Fusarium sarcochroum TaxID=1208366 RepID=A0A8H4WY03_9HYPO|nr:hypothetical protein FSARC_12074 [Fusarium sarcochroum]
MKTRRRRPLACSSCRQKKLRCDRQQPCSGCVRSKGGETECVYAPEPSKPSRSQVRRQPALREQHAELSTQQVVATPDAGDNALATTAATLSQQPLQSDTVPTQHEGESAGWHSSNAGSHLVSQETSPTGLHKPANDGQTIISNNRDENPNNKPMSHYLNGSSGPISAIMVNTRYCAPSSWVYSAFLLPKNVAWLERNHYEKSENWSIVETCKSLSKRLKAKQTFQWAYGDYGKRLPDRALADLLLGNYIRTFETVRRILHVPSFMHQYDRLWDNNNTAPVEFMIQVQLCLALGASLHDDNFSLRPWAMQWVQEATVWLDSSAKPRVVFSTIQTMCLHILARENMRGTAGDQVWIMSGTLLRAAMSMGLHRDPSKLPKVPFAQAEMRRRLWLTVLELVLGSCLDPGAAPLISFGDFDSALPSNFNDSQLNLDQDDNPAPNNLDEYSDSTLQIALGHTFTARLAIAKFASSLAANDQDEASRLSSEYAAACSSFYRSLASQRSHLSDFQRQYCEMVTSRYVFALHIPYLIAGPKSPAYMVSRKACVDAALNLAHSSLPLSSTEEPLLAALRTMGVTRPQGEDFVRLCVTASGTYRSALFQAIMVIAAELIVTVDESKGSFRWAMGLATDSTPMNGDIRTLELLSLLRVALDWTRRRVRTGEETNHDHLWVALVLAHIEALMKGTSVEEAMQASGTAACVEVKAVFEGLIAESSDIESLGEDISPDTNLLWNDDNIWLNFGDLDFDLNLGSLLG